MPGGPAQVVLRDRVAEQRTHRLVVLRSAAQRGSIRIGHVGVTRHGLQRVDHELAHRTAREAALAEQLDRGLGPQVNRLLVLVEAVVLRGDPALREASRESRS